jgi:hypothetical protein
MTENPPGTPPESFVIPALNEIEPPVAPDPAAITILPPETVLLVPAEILIDPAVPEVAVPAAM